MDTITFKKQTYEILEEIDEHKMLVKNGDKLFELWRLGKGTVALDNFRYAFKRLKASGLKIPEVVFLDKKNGDVIIEHIEGPTVFDTLREKDLPDELYEQLFNMNWLARANRILLLFDTKNFIFKENQLYYMPFTFDVYTKEKDLSQRDIYYWFYTKQFRERLIALNLPIDKSRIKNEYEQNKEIVLKVVKYYR